MGEILGVAHAACEMDRKLALELGQCCGELSTFKVCPNVQLREKNNMPKNRWKWTIDRDQHRTHAHRTKIRSYEKLVTLLKRLVETPSKYHNIMARKGQIKPPPPEMLVGKTDAELEEYLRKWNDGASMDSPGYKFRNAAKIHFKDKVATHTQLQCSVETQVQQM